MLTVNFFIEKFEKISEADFKDNSSGCAYTHCGQYKETISKECVALSNLFDKYIKSKGVEIMRKVSPTYHAYSWLVPLINDGGMSNDTIYKQPTAKQRILAALYDIKSKQAVEQVQGIVNTKVEKKMTKEQELEPSVATMLP